MIFFDVVSDLHVDYWGDEWKYDWRAKKKHDKVIICGDLADDLDMAVEEIKIACQVYETVLYVHGNHEATMYFDKLETISDVMGDKLKEYENFIDLSKKNYVLDKERVAFVGCCGWWDFKMRRRSAPEETDDCVARCDDEIDKMYKQDAIHAFNVSWNKIEGLQKDVLVNNIIQQSEKDFLQLIKRIEVLESNGFDICVVTHTVPSPTCFNEKRTQFTNWAYMGSSYMEKLLTRSSIRAFIYGHDHNADVQNNIIDKVMINNARGRPADTNRRYYFPYTFYV
jgi:Icc-related predicted phosphoesterase